MSQAKVVRIPPEIGHCLRETAQLAGVPVEEVVRAAFLGFLRLEPDMQCRVIRQFWTEHKEPSAVDQPCGNGLARLVRNAAARLAGWLHAARPRP